MAQVGRTQERIQALEARLARLRATRSRLVERACHSERRLETRRKIILGGTVLAAVEREGVPPLKTRGELVGWLESRLQRPQDRAAFGLDGDRDS